MRNNLKIKCYISNSLDIQRYKIIILDTDKNIIYNNYTNENASYI